MKFILSIAVASILAVSAVSLAGCCGPSKGGRMHHEYGDK
jgi:hypothetical protein